MTLLGNTTTSFKTPITPDMDAVGPPSKALRRFQILYEDGQGVDFDIVCNDRNWKVHRFVLCIYSDVFACACDGRFREAAEKRLDLSTEDEDSVDALVRYMYYFAYPSAQTTQASLLKHVNVAILADKYDLSDLVTLADEAAASMLKKGALEFTADLTAAADRAYEADGPTSAFRAALLEAALSLDKTQPEQHEVLSAMIRALPCLAQDVAMALITPPQSTVFKPKTDGGPSTAFCTRCHRHVTLYAGREECGRNVVYTCRQCYGLVISID